MTLISVIVPVYNSENYLEQCIKSICKQSYGELEIILIDDGSKDNSFSICQSFAQKDSRIRVLHQNNKGVSSARNAGLEYASGDYVTFVDSDDYIDENMYSSMVEISQEYNADVVMCDCIKEYSDYSYIYTHPIRGGFYNSSALKKEYYNHLIMMENVEYPATISNCLMLIKKCNLPKYADNIKYSEDLLFGAQVLYNAESFYYMKGYAFYHYNCKNIDSTTHVYHEDKWENNKKLFELTKRYFSEKRFEEQINKMLLFFVYNTLSDIRYGNEETKIRKANAILDDPDVRNMFRKLNVIALPINIKLKILTLMYKYKIGLNMIFK